VTAAVGRDPDARAELEEERDFLLRSLDQLEAERDAGELDEDDYRSLKDGYTARAAEVLRALDEDRAVREDAFQAAPARPRWRRPVAVLVVAGLAVGAGLAVAGAAGSRRPGETVTGGDGQTAASSRLAEAASVAREDPTRALELYDEVIEDDPRSVEAWAERSLLLASLSVGLERPGLLDEARRSVDQALAIEPEDPRSRFYLGLVELFAGDRPAAEAAFEQALASDPPPPLRAAISARLEELRAPPAPSTTAAP
jgi:tetratricopeptide (TPR) repeat protein